MRLRIQILDDELDVHRFYRESMKSLESNSPIETSISAQKTLKLGIERQLMISLVWGVVVLLITLASADKLCEMIKNLVII